MKFIGRKLIALATTGALIFALCPVQASASQEEQVLKDGFAAETEELAPADGTANEPDVNPGQLTDGDEPVDREDEQGAASDSAEGDGLSASAVESATMDTLRATPSPSYLGEEVTVADGIYEIATTIDLSLFVDVTGGSAANGVPVSLYPRNTTLAQRYRLVRNSDTGTYVITNVNSGRALDVRGASRQRGALVQQWDSNGTAAQQWRLYEASGNRVYIVSELKTPDGQPLVLDVYHGKATSGARIQTWIPNGTAAQQWSLSAIRRTVDDGVYEVRSSLSSELLLDVQAARRTNGGNVWTWTRNCSPAQWWRVRYDASTGYYTLVNCNSEKALECANGDHRDGTNIDIYTSSASRSQRWTIEKNKAGGYVLRSALGGKAVDIMGGNKKPGTNVRLWRANGTAAQGWTFASPSVPTASGSEGVYEIVLASNMTFCLDVAGASTADGANVRLWSRNASNAQKWRVGTADKNGWRTITAGHNGAYLSANAKGNLCLSTRDAGDAQRWRIKTSGLGYVLTNKATGKVCDVVGGRIAQGTNVQTYSANGTNAQRFMLVTTAIPGTRIMGRAQANQAQAVRYLKAYYRNHGYSLPRKWVKDGETLEKLVGYFWEEAEAEGVRADVALAQSLHETGYFQFGNLVQPDQYNFAGLGATGPGKPGQTFKNA